MSWVVEALIDVIKEKLGRTIEFPPSTTSRLKRVATEILEKRHELIEIARRELRLDLHSVILGRFITYLEFEAAKKLPIIVVQPESVDTDFVDVDGLLNEADADAGAVVTVWGGDSTAGAALGDVDLPATERIKIVGGQGASAATGGTITGIIYYYVKDDGKESV